MRRWWCAAAGLGRRVLSSSATASHVRPLPQPLISKDASFPFPFSFSCRRQHSLHAPLSQGFFHPATALLSSACCSGPDRLRGVVQAHQQQVRHYAKERSRTPLTPTESKVNKYKRHNAHLSSILPPSPS
uniref:Uncharacterized protein n=1 Tax=Arundo donax TaxID=35708 RepID=A0A0A9D018_ARUDO